MATIKEVSRYANVSMATVSRVLNGTAPVANQTKQRVLSAVEKLNYQPNAFARGLVTNLSGGVGVVVNDLASPYFGPMLRGVEEVVEAAGMHLLVSSGHAKAEPEACAVSFLSQQRSDALILHVEGMSDDDLIDLSKRDVPIVLIGRYVAELAAQSIYLDNEYGGYLATRYLLEHGHTRIGHVAGPPALQDSRDRLAGYRRALEEAGLPLNSDHVIEANFKEEAGQRATKRLLARRSDLTALFIANDQMAAGALAALREAGLEVPRDMSLVGFDDVLLARYLYPPLTTVAQPIAQMGRAAAQLALARLRGEAGEGVTHKFDPNLVVRSSVAAAPKTP